MGEISTYIKLQIHLSIIEIHFCQMVNFFAHYYHCFIRYVCPLDKVPPDLAFHFNTEFIVFQHKMNFTEDCFIEVGHSVCGQKYDALTIFNFVKEHWDKFIACDIML